MSRRIASRRVAIAITAVIPAHGGEIRTPRRLGELPYIGELDSTPGWIRWVGQSASRRRRADVIRYPVGDVPSLRAGATVVGGDNAGVAFLRGNPSCVNS